MAHRLRGLTVRISSRLDSTPADLSGEATAPLISFPCYPINVRIAYPAALSKLILHHCVAELDTVCELASTR
jgi:hypothetical protein